MKRNLKTCYKCKEQFYEFSYFADEDEEVESLACNKCARDEKLW